MDCHERDLVLAFEVIKNATPVRCDLDAFPQKNLKAVAHSLKIDVASIFRVALTQTLDPGEVQSLREQPVGHCRIRWLITHRLSKVPRKHSDIALQALLPGLIFGTGGRSLGIKPLGRFVRTTDSQNDSRIFPNLYRKNIPYHPDRVWGADFTYIRLSTGFYVLAAILDACSRKVIGYALSHRLDMPLALAAFHAAVAERAPHLGCTNNMTNLLIEFGRRVGLHRSRERARFDSVCAPEHRNLTGSDLNDCFFKNRVDCPQTRVHRKGETSKYCQ